MIVNVMVNVRVKAIEMSIIRIRVVSMIVVGDGRN
jgi:hypothetical protein